MHRTRRTPWLPIGILVASLGATLACSGAIADDENTKSGKDRQTKGAADREATPSPPTDCVQSAASGSGGSDGSCQYSEEWQCSSGPVDFSCACPGNTATCNGVTFTHDCTHGCAPTAAERTRCRLPTPPSGGGSTSSSSGSTSGSSGGSSSSSGGSSSGSSTSSSGG